MIILVMSGATTAEMKATQESNGEQNEQLVDSWVSILDMEDPIGDDHGPGTYLYPTHAQFAPHEGLLDIEHFRVDALGEHIRFQITFGAITNPWKAPEGFSHQLIQIYIDHEPGGETRPFFPGANVVFSPKAPWDTMLKVTGYGSYLFHATDKRIDEPEPYKASRVQVLSDNKTIEITIPMGRWIGWDALMDASFYLLVGSQDGFGPDNYRAVKKDVSEWYFSGGDDSGYCPNVIDILTPKGKSQHRILSSYDSETRLLAVIEPVHRPNPVRMGLIYLLAVAIGLALWYSWHKRDKISKDQ